MMPPIFTEQLLHKYPIISDQVEPAELRRILIEFETVLQKNVAGDVVELGCFVGTTSLFLQRLINKHESHEQLHVYDSFEGLPTKTAHDRSPVGEQFKDGELFATKAQLIKHFKKANLPLPIIHKNWFDQLAPSDIPSTVCFAFLDGDYYQSITDSLKLVWPRLAPGATVVVDDYQNEALPGAKKAVDQWLHSHPGSARLQVSHSLAIIRT